MAERGRVPEQYIQGLDLLQATNNLTETHLEKMVGQGRPGNKRQESHAPHGHSAPPPPSLRTLTLALAPDGDRFLLQFSRAPQLKQNGDFWEGWLKKTEKECKLNRPPGSLRTQAPGSHLSLLQASLNPMPEPTCWTQGTLGLGLDQNRE